MTVSKEILIFSFFFTISMALKTHVEYMNPIDRPFVIAHRGESGLVPENTLESFAMAFETKADFIELDIVLSKEKELMVLHDAFLSKTTNILKFPQYNDRKKLWHFDFKDVDDFFTDDFTVEELKSFSIVALPNRGEIFNERFKMPTLDEVIEQSIRINLKRKKEIPKERLTGIFMEVKNGQMYRDVFGTEFEIGKIVADKLRKYGLDDPIFASENLPILVQSFDRQTVELFSKILPKLPRNQLVSKDYNIPLDSIVNYAHGVGPKYDFLYDDVNNVKPNAYLEKARSLGLNVFSWTFKDDDLCFGKDYIEMYQIAYNILKIQGVFSDFSINAMTVFKSESRKKAQDSEK